MEQLLLTIDVKCLDAVSVEGHSQTVVMVPFTGKAKGDFFNGEIIGSSVDTQRYKNDGTNSLSARYMIEGVDFEGKKCKVFVENNVSGDSWKPSIVTNSQVLKDWETSALRSTVEGCEGGVTVKIFKA
ncbi:MAG: DUF3237 family protein [Treponema sp.]|nr:DUF3237 family protein [Treponema sp.]